MTSSSSTRPAPGASQKWKDAPKAPVSTRPAAAGPIAFRCPHCQCQVKVSAAASGKQGQCPRCQSVFTIPKKSFDAPRTAPDAAGGLMPLDSGLTPLGNDDFGALSPLGNTSDPFGGLGNLDFPAQDPLGGSPLASSPALGGPLGGMAPMPGGAMNPYSSPATFGSTAAAGSDHTGKPKRSGLPWDTQGDSSFLSTVKMLLFSPRTAFYKMRRTGGIGRPLLFCVMGTVIGVLISTAYNLIFQMVMLLIGGLGENADVAAAGFMIGAFAGMAFSVAGAAVGAVIASFLYSGIYHLFLMMFGGAREGFETTYRVYCYSAGAAAMCSVIPCVGGLVMFVVHLVTLIIGFWAGHETTLGRSIGAVLIPFVLCLAVAITAVVLVISAIMGGMAPVPE